jgi:hypothetical protein
MIKFSCKNCGQKLNIDDKYSGKRVKCPVCKDIFLVPNFQTISMEQTGLDYSTLPNQVKSQCNRELGEINNNNERDLRLIVIISA